VQEREETVPGAGGAARGVLRGDEVARAVDDEAPLEPADGLDDVGVFPHDGVHQAGPEEGAGDAPLLGGRPVDVLDPPV